MIESGLGGPFPAADFPDNSEMHRQSIVNAENPHYTEIYQRFAPIHSQPYRYANSIRLPINSNRARVTKADVGGRH